MHECLSKLLRSSDDEDSLECLCQLLRTIGQDIDKKQPTQVTAAAAAFCAMMMMLFGPFS